MAKHIENIVVGTLATSPEELFAIDQKDWERLERDQTLFTEERYLPKILVEAGIVPSISEVRRNRPDLNIALENKYQFLELKWGRKRFWLAVGLSSAPKESLLLWH